MPERVISLEELADRHPEVAKAFAEKVVETDIDLEAWSQRYPDVEPDVWLVIFWIVKTHAQPAPRWKIWFEGIAIAAVSSVVLFGASEAYGWVTSLMEHLNTTGGP